MRARVPRVVGCTLHCLTFALVAVRAEFNATRSIPIKDLVRRLRLTEAELIKVGPNWCSLHPLLVANFCSLCISLLQTVEPLLAGKYKILVRERGASGLEVLSWNLVRYLGLNWLRRTGLDLIFVAL